MTKQKQQRKTLTSGAMSIFPREWHELGEALFEQQMWCWGCDVRRESGNLLLAHGMEKHPAPEPRFHSAYSRELDSGSVLTLWGWGLWIAGSDYGSAFLSRTRFCVRCSQAVNMRPTAWSEASLPPVGAPQDEAHKRNMRHLLSTAFHWIASYERWLIHSIGPEYREHALAAWPQRRRYRGGIPVHAVAEHWMQLAQITTDTLLN